MTRRFTIAAGFYHDHVMRELPAGRLVREAGSRVVVDLDAVGYDALLGDARYYAEHMTDPENVDPETIRVAESAARVLRVLEAHPWPESAGAADEWEREQLAAIAANPPPPYVPPPPPRPRPHTITVERPDPRRQLHRAVCSCGEWASPLVFTADHARAAAFNHTDRYPARDVG